MLSLFWVASLQVLTLAATTTVGIFSETGRYAGDYQRALEAGQSLFMILRGTSMVDPEAQHHSVAGLYGYVSGLQEELLKIYFRMLPEPLIPFVFYTHLMKICKSGKWGM